jgi:hypothetical protein
MLFTLSGCTFYLDKEKEPKYEEVVTYEVLDKKHIEYHSINKWGDFSTHRYFLYKSGEVDQVDLKLYMECEPGDTIKITNQIRIEWNH